MNTELNPADSNEELGPGLMDSVNAEVCERDPTKVDISVHSGEDCLDCAAFSVERAIDLRNRLTDAIIAALRNANRPLPADVEMSPDCAVLYRELAEGLDNMIDGGRLTQQHFPDDYQWLTKKLTAIRIAAAIVNGPAGKK